MIEVILLLTFMLVAAVVAVEIKSLLSAVVAHAAVGLALCVIFLALRAPEVAITQLTVELLILVILIRVTGVRQEMSEYVGGLRETFAKVSVLAFILVFGSFAAYSMRSLHLFGEPLMTQARAYIEVGFGATGVVNLVSSILLDFRAYDTLGLVAVMLASVCATFVVLRKKGKEGLYEWDDTDS